MARPLQQQARRLWVASHPAAQQHLEQPPVGAMRLHPIDKQLDEDMVTSLGRITSGIGEQLIRLGG